MILSGDKLCASLIREKERLDCDVTQVLHLIDQNSIFITISGKKTLTNVFLCFDIIDNVVFRDVHDHFQV